MPEKLSSLPYLQPIYDEPEFIVRNIYRLYGGWYDGIPSHLKPAPEAAQAKEIAALAGGAETLAERAEELVREGDCRLACHLADWAFLADPDNASVRVSAGRVYMARMKIESSTMAYGIFTSAARSCGASMEGEWMEKGHLIMAQTERGRLKR
jgi:alkyl sulfatase BDS1-like metallo-beta-lactamase superfamily hydrolase